MSVLLDIPSELETQLDQGFGNLDRAALEALAAQAYLKNILSLSQISMLLGHDNRWETQEVLSQNHAWPGTTADEVLSDMKNVREFLASE